MGDFFRFLTQDDKSAANDFQETLERIVNEIKNTTVRPPANQLGPIGRTLRG